MQPLISNNIILLNQLASYLKLVPNSLYTMHQPILLNSSIGMHTRHIIEFYSCFCSFFVAGQQRIVNYDLRHRDLAIEQSSVNAVAKTEQIIKSLSSIAMIDYPITLVVGTHSEEQSMHESSIMRELLYLQEHSTHHLATIRMATKIEAPNFEFPANFGFAVSTTKSKMMSH
jgi:hypothetical protein